MREDHDIVKYIYEHDSEAEARAWQRLPLLSVETLDQRLQERPIIDDWIFRRCVCAFTTSPDLRGAPWRVYARLDMGEDGAHWEAFGRACGEVTRLTGTEVESRPVLACALKVLMYFSACPDVVVEERNASPRCTAKTAKRKPWLRDDLPRIIAIDPTRHIIRNPSAPQGGTHASPRAHARRGHWRYLKEQDRGVFVRPTWVGPHEWSDRGQTYKLICP